MWLKLMIRVFDILIALITLLMSMPIFLVLLCLSAYFFRSPIFAQVRLGKGEHLFTILKFRSMSTSALEVETHNLDISHLNAYGRFIREKKLDELPQLLNVLKGDLSFIGPRPGLTCSKVLIAERRARGIFATKPGISGIAQIRGVDMSAPRKVARLDLLWKSNISIKLYFKLMLATVLLAVRPRRKSSINS